MWHCVFGGRGSVNDIRTVIMSLNSNAAFYFPVTGPDLLHLGGGSQIQHSDLVLFSNTSRPLTRSLAHELSINATR